MIKWNCSNEDSDKIFEVAERAVVAGLSTNLMNTSMDLTAAHCNGCRLDLDALLRFDDFNFSHDVCGIAHHIDRNTGKLLNCFVPRCAHVEF